MIWAKIASVLLFLGVATGAFGAHALGEKLSAHQHDIFRTAVLYQFIHALALFAVAWLSALTADPRITWAGICLTGGIILFSGSLYLLSLTGIKIFGAVTPIGGILFLAGWTLLFLGTPHS